ncbi:MAG: tetratricopeptide repeat protein [Mucilaginibacter sp.]|nr:tetratricopeptide repeat protein [Mucilaginibacter sp.]
MTTYHKTLITLLLLFCTTNLFAQDKSADVPTLIKEGRALNTTGKYTEAVAKFDEALKIDPNNTDVMENKGISLALAQKYDEALPCFEKVVAVNNNQPHAYVSMGNIYSMRKDYDKAIYYYTKAIGILPRDARIWNSLSSAYLFSKKYAQAQSAATETIKMGQRQANVYQLYAIAAFFQAKNAEALMGLCNYFMLANPKEKSTADTYRTLTLVLHDKPRPGAEPVAKMQQETVAKAIASATEGKTNLTPIDSLTLQLTAAFKAINEQQDQYGSPFFSKYFGSFFGTMAATDQMDTFAHFIMLSISPAENAAWLKEHQDKVTAFVSWIKSTKREIE